MIGPSGPDLCLKPGYTIYNHDSYYKYVHSTDDSEFYVRF